MKGLLIKDFQLLKMQRMFFLAIVLIAIGIISSSYNSSFSIGYLGFIMPLFVLSTISYDEIHNGNAFLFTLPISRKEYVIEKYCFGILLEIGAIILSLAITLGIGLIKGMVSFSDTLVSVPFVFSGVLLLLAIAIPVQIKFGGEKSRIAMMVICGIVFALGYGTVKLSHRLAFDAAAFIQHFADLHAAVLILVPILFALCMLLLSIKISTSILCKKEF